MTRRITIRRAMPESTTLPAPVDDGSRAVATISGQRVLLSDLARWISTRMQGRADNLDAFLNEHGMQSMTRNTIWSSLPPLPIRTTARRAEVYMDYDMRSLCYTFTLTIPPLFGAQDTTARVRMTSDELGDSLSRDNGEYVLDRISSLLGASIGDQVTLCMRRQVAEMLRSSLHARHIGAGSRES